MLAAKVPLAPKYNIERLELIIITVMEYLLQIHKHCAFPDRQMGPMFVNVIQGELMRYLPAWFALAPSSLIPKGVNPQTAAKVWSWAIFGTGISEGREHRRNQPRRLLGKSPWC